MTPKITVFMIAYNAERYISDSILSILNQTFYDFELLIVDDGSTDYTVNIVNQFTDSRIRLLRNVKNMGLTYTRNIAVKEARGEYLAILDSDDIALENRLTLQYNFLQLHPDVALCGGHAIVINKEGIQINDDKIIVPVETEKLKMTILFRNVFVNSTVMYKTSVLRELNGYMDYAPAEDYELFVRISDKYPIANINEVLVKYRMHENNISAIKFELAKQKIKDIKKNQLANLNISPNELLMNTLFSILMLDYKSFKFADYLRLLIELKSANLSLKKYEAVAFEKMLFDIWFEAIYVKEAKMNALSLLFNRNLFKWSYVNARQLRKVFKLSLKGIGRSSA